MHLNFLKEVSAVTLLSLLSSVSICKALTITNNTDSDGWADTYASGIVAVVGELIHGPSARPMLGMAPITLFNTIDDGRADGKLAFKLAFKIQSELHLTTTFYAREELFWKYLRMQRMRWEANINLVIIDKEEKALTYLNHLKDRFFTGTGLGLSDARRVDLIYRNIFHLFVLVGDVGERFFSSGLAYSAWAESMEEEMQVLALLLQPEGLVTKVWWHKSEPDGLRIMRLVNQWTPVTRSFRDKRFLFPPLQQVYSNLKGRNYKHPVMHKPPWNYVKYDEVGAFVDDYGGRDSTLLEMVAKILNFTVTSINLEERCRGSNWKRPQFDFPCIIGRIHRREDPYHFYFGDTTQTYDRNSAVEFTFYVMADSGAFITRAPKRFIPFDIFVRPFAPKVWAGGAISFLCTFGALYSAGRAGKILGEKINHPDVLDGRSPYISAGKILEAMLRAIPGQDVWYFTKPPKHRKSPYLVGPFQLIFGLWILALGFILAPSHRGAVQSFFTLPFEGVTVDTLADLHRVMDKENYTIGMVPYSSSYGIVSEGGAIYEQIFSIMEEKDNYWIDNVPQGMRRVLEDPYFVVMAGREKMLYDAKTMGEHRFHMGKEVFFPKFKSMVLRNGSPLKEAMDKFLIRLYNGGIISKLTRDSFIGINRYKAQPGSYTYIKTNEEGTRSGDGDQDDAEPKALKLHQMSSIFYLSSISLAVASLTFLVEVVGQTQFQPGLLIPSVIVKSILDLQ